MCFLCDNQYIPVGGWDNDHQNHDDDRPFSHWHCPCAVNSRPHKRVPTAGWLIIPHLKKHLKDNRRTYYGLISLILSWAKLSPYAMRRFPGRVRIVYRLGRRDHIQGCCKLVYLPFRTKTTYVRRSIRYKAGHCWKCNRCVDCIDLP